MGGGAVPKKLFRFVYALNYVFQAAFCMLTPTGLFVGGGWLLVHRCGVGKWAMVVSILLGVLLGFYSMFSYIIKTAKYVDPTTPNGKENDRGRKQP